MVFFIYRYMYIQSKKKRSCFEVAFILEKSVRSQMREITKYANEHK